MKRFALALGVAALFLVGCGEEVAVDESAAGTDATGEASSDRHPDVVHATARMAPDGPWTFDVTISSPYDGPDRYADAWRILAPDGRILGVRELSHHHAGEQPFTRSLGGVEIPPSVTFVTIEARDLVNGWGGETFELALDPSG